MISPPRLSFVWNVAMAGMGLAFWAYAVLTLVLPDVFTPRGYILGILGALLAIFLMATGVAAGKNTVERAWDEGTEHDSNRAYKFGFTIAWMVYVVFWVLISSGWVRMEAAFPAMGGLTGGSYCLYMGIAGMKGWYEARNAPD